jgi:hypothetical protein
MPPETTPPPQEFSRKSFFLFLVLAPACFLVIAAIVVLVQYRQFKGMVSTDPEIRMPALESALQGRVASLRASFEAFASGNSSPDSLWLSAEDLNALLAASPVARAQDLRFRVEVVADTVVVRSTQPVQAMQGRAAWAFRKIAPDGYLNARIEGLPQFEKNHLALSASRGFINGQRVPRASLTRRGGMSPPDFLESQELYAKLLGVLGEVKLEQGKILLVRK